MSDLQRVLDWLDKRSGGPDAGYSQEYADAARVIRELAADYARLDKEWSRLGMTMHLDEIRRLDAAREKWRLE